MIYILILTFTCANGFNKQVERAYVDFKTAKEEYDSFKENIGTMILPQSNTCKLSNVKAGHRTMKKGSFL